jgi:glycosyltransferase involved in cell wall biosynthesis
MENKLKIAFVGNFYGHGSVYDQWGTSFCILLSRLDYVDRIDVICPVSTNNYETVFPNKINIKESFDLSRSFSVMNIKKVIKAGNYDLAVFNYGPTVFGSNNLINLLGLFTLISTSRLCNTVIISQGSSLTNDASNLGYNSVKDKIRYKILKTLEKHLYRKVKSFAQLPMYEKMLKDSVRGNKVLGVLKSDYIDAIFTVYLNGIIDRESIDLGAYHDIPKILLHGFWGPQKNIEFAMNTLSTLKKNGYEFILIISGGINVHFPEYKNYFQNVLSKYKVIITEYYGYIPEKELMHLFLDADLILMPYNVPGGQSGVLEMSSFFGNNVICLDFPEFREEVKEGDQITLVDQKMFYKEIERHLISFKSSKRKIEIGKKINSAKENIDEFVKRALATKES